MKAQLEKRLARTNALFMDALAAFGSEHLGERLGTLPSNTVGEQFWCVVGARHSYVTAAAAGAWQGFSCPLSAEGTTDPAEVARTLTSTFEEVSGLLGSLDMLSGVQEDYLLDLLEHEVQHHGQLIRYLYGLKVEVPESWKQRYALD
ncbi:MAG: hypothetical protein WD557_00780 [Dehalococcoidia bacterium]